MRVSMLSNRCCMLKSCPICRTVLTISETHIHRGFHHVLMSIDDERWHEYRRTLVGHWLDLSNRWRGDVDFQGHRTFPWRRNWGAWHCGTAAWRGAGALGFGRMSLWACGSHVALWLNAIPNTGGAFRLSVWRIASPSPSRSFSLMNMTSFHSATPWGRLRWFLTPPPPGRVRMFDSTISSMLANWVREINKQLANAEADKVCVAVLWNEQLLHYVCARRCTNVEACEWGAYHGLDVVLGRHIYQWTALM